MAKITQYDYPFTNYWNKNLDALLDDREQLNNDLIAQNEKIDKFINDSNQKYETFTDEIEGTVTNNLQTMQDLLDAAKEDLNNEIYRQDVNINQFIDDTNAKLDEQDNEIAEAIAYMKDNMDDSVVQIINQYITQGLIDVGFKYTAETERLDLIVTEV